MLRETWEDAYWIFHLNYGCYLKGLKLRSSLKDCWVLGGETNYLRFLFTIAVNDLRFSGVPLSTGTGGGGVLFLMYYLWMIVFCILFFWIIVISSRLC